MPTSILGGGFLTSAMCGAATAPNNFANALLQPPGSSQPAARLVAWVDQQGLFTATLAAQCPFLLAVGDDPAQGPTITLTVTYGFPGNLTSFGMTLNSSMTRTISGAYRSCVTLQRLLPLATPCTAQPFRVQAAFTAQRVDVSRPDLQDCVPLADLEEQTAAAPAPPPPPAPPGAPPPPALPPPSCYAFDPRAAAPPATPPTPTQTKVRLLGALTAALLRCWLALSGLSGQLGGLTSPSPAVEGCGLRTEDSGL
ncbi:hypothetical protein V8C86DRAFT_3140375 [Haematococcus lacustris]